MGLQITTERHDSYVSLRAVGHLTEDGMLQIASVIRSECETTGIKAALIDYASIQGSLSATRLYYVTLEFVKTVGPSIKVAYINPPAHWAPEDDQLSRDVAANHGGLLRLFETKPAAIAWLTTTAPEPGRRLPAGPGQP